MSTEFVVRIDYISGAYLTLAHQGAPTEDTFQ